MRALVESRTASVPTCQDMVRTLSEHANQQARTQLHRLHQRKKEMFHRIKNDVDHWKRMKLSERMQKNPFSTNPVKYTNEERVKILNARKWEKIASLMPKIALVALGIIGISLLVTTGIGAVSISAGIIASTITVDTIVKVGFIAGGVLCYFTAVGVDVLKELMPKDTTTLKERNVRVIEDSEFWDFINVFVAPNGEGKPSTYPNKTLLADKDLHKIYHTYKEKLGNT